MNSWEKKSQRSSGVRTIIKHIQKWNRHYKFVFVCATKLSQVPVEWDPFFRSGCPRYTKRNTKNCVGAQVGFVVCAVQRVEKIVNGLLVLDIHIFFDYRRSNDSIDIVYSLGNSFT